MKIKILKALIKPIELIGTYIFKIWGSIFIFLINHPILLILTIIIVLILSIKIKSR